jgi:hypothetical protein
VICSAPTRLAGLSRSCETQIGLAFNKGRFQRVLGAGRHLIGRGEVELIDVTKPALEHAMFDVLITKPDVRERLEVIELTDDQRAVVYRDGRLFTILGAGRYAFRNVLSRITFEVLARRAAELGIAVRGVGLKDIVLPGDMRTLFNQVVAATKESEANLIRRREETAAARSQANTARPLAENPVLARLKELEMLKEVLAGTSATFVFGQGELTDQIKSLVGANPKT